MRQRKIKGLEEKLDIYNGGVKLNPRFLKGKWQKAFDRARPLYMELGCGKGQFACRLADVYSDRNVIAVEGNRSVVLRALQKAARHYGGYDPRNESGRSDTPTLEAVVPPGLFAPDPVSAGVPEDASFDSPYRTSEDDTVFSIAPNLVLANSYMRDVTDYFTDGELSGIYLNFSDPWPKARQERRRLTHRGFLKGYRKILIPGSFLEFKTDNESLFRFSVEEFKSEGLEIAEYTENLHSSSNNYATKNFMTEYEQKFSSRGKSIFYCKVIF